MLPTLDEVRHRRGFLTNMERALRTVTRLDLDWPGLEAFRESFLPTIRDPLIREFVADQLRRRIDNHPLRAFSPGQARQFTAMSAAYRASNLFTACDADGNQL